MAGHSGDLAEGLTSGSPVRIPGPRREPNGNRDHFVKDEESSDLLVIRAAR